MHHTFIIVVNTLISNIHPTRLENNQLAGTLPTALCQLNHLEKLVLNTNQLSGTLPACLGNLKQLDLHDNAFTSPLAAELIQQWLV